MGGLHPRVQDEAQSVFFFENGCNKEAGGITYLPRKKIKHQLKVRNSTFVFYFGEGQRKNSRGV